MITSSSLFSTLMQAFDAASRADQMRLMEQSTRQAQARRAAEANAATSLANVVVRSDGFEAVKQVPVTLAQSAPLAAEQLRKPSLRVNEAVDLAAARLAAQLVALK